MKNPSEQDLTKIDAIILRAYEMDNNFHTGDLAEFLLKTYGMEIDVCERLKIYHNEDTGFDFKNHLN